MVLLDLIYQEFLLAGAEGFEPPYRGIKIRCLTTWLRPNRLGRLTGRPPAGNKTAGEPLPCRRQDRSLSSARGWYPRIPSGRVKGAERAASGRRAVAAGKSPAARWRSAAVSRLFPGYGQFSRILAVGNSRFRAPAVRGFGCSKQLICHRYLQRDQAIFALARSFLREFSRFNREFESLVQRRPLP